MSIRFCASYLDSNLYYRRNEMMYGKQQRPSGVKIITSSNVQPKKKKGNGGCGCGGSSKQSK